MRLFDHHEQRVVVARENVNHHLKAQEKGGQNDFHGRDGGQMQQPGQRQKEDAGGNRNPDANHAEQQRQGAALQLAVLVHLPALAQHGEFVAGVGGNAEVQSGEIADGS